MKQSNHKKKSMEQSYSKTKSITAVFNTFLKRYFKHYPRFIKETKGDNGLTAKAFKAKCWKAFMKETEGGSRLDAYEKWLRKQGM